MHSEASYQCYHDNYYRDNAHDSRMIVSCSVSLAIPQSVVLMGFR